jgi:hypothetical protein
MFGAKNARRQKAPFYLVLFRKLNSLILTVTPSSDIPPVGKSWHLPRKMKKTIDIGFACSLMILGAANLHALPSEPLFIDDKDGNIGEVDLSTGSVTIIGNTGAGVALHDLGFTENGDLYGTGFTTFYSVNTATGAATTVSDYNGAGNGGINALVGDGSELYAASNRTTNLYCLDPTTFAVKTLTGNTLANSAGDLTIGADGNLFEADKNGDLEKITIDGDSFSASIVGSMGNARIVGLATGDDGVTYAVSETDTEIYTLNLNSGALTPFMNYGGKGLGLASGEAFIKEASTPPPAAVPEPASVYLFLIGIAGVLFYGWRKKLV